MSDYSRLTLARLSAIVILLIAYLALPSMVGVATASPGYTAVEKPMEFYFHNLDTPVRVAGLETKYVMNTTRWFRFLTQQEAHANSFYKPVGLPKIEVDFYLYPNLAGPVTIDGLWPAAVRRTSLCARLRCPSTRR